MVTKSRKRVRPCAVHAEAQAGCGRQAACLPEADAAGTLRLLHMFANQPPEELLLPLSYAFNLQVGEGKAAYEAAVKAVKSWDHLQLGESDAWPRCPVATSPEGQQQPPFAALV